MAKAQTATKTKPKTAPKKKPAKGKTKAKPKAKNAAPWDNRIIGNGTEDPEQILAHPDNWRIHPSEQRDALARTLDRVGWVQSIIVNQRTGRLIDGHLRVDLAVERGEKQVPVGYVDLTEEEEKIALAALDPITGMAIPDSEKLRELVASLDLGDNANLAAEVGSLIALKSGGKGVASLVSTRREMTVQHLALSKLRTNTYTVKAMTEIERGRLRASMKAAGLLQPLIVRPIKGGVFEIVDGLQRWEAAKELEWQTIACRVKEMDDNAARLTHLAVNRLTGRVVSTQMAGTIGDLRKTVGDGPISKVTGMNKASADQYGAGDASDFETTRTPDGVPVRQYKVEKPEHLDDVDVPRTLMIPLDSGEYLEVRETLDKISADWSEAVMIVVRAWRSENG